MNRNLGSKPRPFGVVPDARFYFPHQSIQSALDTVVRAVTRSEGPVAVLGGSGFGKSLLVELLCDALDNRLDTVKLHSARICSRQALLQSILYELQMPYRGLSEGELRLSLLDRLEPSPETAPEGILILVDEAHTLHAKLLDELRLLTNFSRNNQCRVKLVLFGNMRLEETLANPTLESLNQRLAARCYLQPMNREETFEYIRHQLRIAGRSPESCITADALRSVFSASDGIPRLVNQVMDHALVVAGQKSQEKITSELVNDSWADLQQLPTPWSTGASKPASASDGGTVEFGLLEDSEFEELAHQEPVGSRETSHDTTNHEAKECRRACKNPVCNSPKCQAGKQTESLESQDDQHGDAHGDQHNFFAAFACPISELEVAIEDPVPFGRNEAENDSSEWQPVAADESSIGRPTSAGDSQLQSGTLIQQGNCGEPGGNHACDPMGHWENDPPLLVESPKSFDTASPMDLDLASDPDCEDRTEELFGTDFDLEELLPSQSSFGSHQSARLDTRSDATADPSTPESDDYIVRLQQNAETLSRLERFELEDRPVETAHEERLEPSEPPPNDTSLWSINVGATSSGEGVEENIEEIVSQLNFSAFTVDPFSVEQIPLHSDGVPIDAREFLFQPIEQAGLPEGIRVNENQKVMMLHRPTETNQFFGACEDYDDDRDLLIIEEQVGSTNQMLLQNLPSEPAQKPSPYTQLFARLRK